MMERICGNCKYHKPDGEDWVCDNEDGEYFSDFTGYKDHCPDWSDKDEVDD